MKLPPSAFKVQMLQSNGVWRTTPGGFSTRERAEIYARKFYEPGKYRVLAGHNVPKIKSRSIT